MRLTIREPGSALTHFIGLVMALMSIYPLMTQREGSGLWSLAIFGASMILLYGASTTYHSVNVSGKLLNLYKRLDHLMIFVLIAGTYTPICVIVLQGTIGTALLITIWSIALAGMITKAFWIHCPKWFSSIIYIGMGWACVFVMGRLLEVMPAAAFGWLLGGGIFYTVGGIIYAFKFKLFNAKHKYFGSHEIFHLFIMAGTICHFILMYGYVVHMQ